MSGVPRLRPGYLVLALTLFSALAVGTTGGILLARYRAAALAAIADRQALLVSLQARLLDEEVARLVAEMNRLSKLAEVDLADQNLEPEKRVLRIARRDTTLFSAAIFILDARGEVLWSEPQGAPLLGTPAKLVGEARGEGGPILEYGAGALLVAAPSAGRGAIVGQVNTASRDVFGEGILRAVRRGGFALLLETSRVGAPVRVAQAGEARTDLGAGAGQRWEEAQDGRRWLVTEAPLGERPLLLRLAAPAQRLEAAVWESLRSLIAIVAGALLLAVVVGALLAVAIGRLERAEVQLGRQGELVAMGKTAAAIAHEVKNSLNGLSIALDLLAQGRAPAAAVAEVHAQARAEVARLKGVADDLTLFAAPPRLDLGEVDLAELCHRAAALSADLAHDCGVEVVLRLPPDAAAIRVQGDAQKLLGALSNLVRNGIEAMGPGAFGEPLGEAAPPRERRLEVGLARRPRQVTVEVADRGPGLPAPVRARLFEPFVTTKRTGTGLGLAIARRVVEAHGGTLDAADREGGGTVMRLALPLSRPLSLPRRPAASWSPP
jgi:signal transduction histidine kinase